MFAIAEISADGRVEFSEQESGEALWHPFTPSEDERAPWRSGFKPANPRQAGRSSPPRSRSKQ
jgi:hypothetical protein